MPVVQENISCHTMNQALGFQLSIDIQLFNPSIDCIVLKMSENHQ